MSRIKVNLRVPQRSHSKVVRPSPWCASCNLETPPTDKRNTLVVALKSVVELSNRSNKLDQKR
jgi:hypothetical protein